MSYEGIGMSTGDPVETPDDPNGIYRSTGLRPAAFRTAAEGPATDPYLPVKL